ncbi:MAG: RDD family protein [Flavobacteriales bacterium]|nr:RDD family protein [Flavobacteriales bacterium]
MVYNTVLRRVLAFIVDALLFQALAYFSVILGFGIDEGWWIALSFVYSIALHTLYGATLGKWIWGIKVTDLSEQRRPTLFQSVLREAVYIVLLIAPLFFLTTMAEDSLLSKLSLWSMPLFAIFDLGVALGNPKSRSIHDYLASSVVVRVPR